MTLLATTATFGKYATLPFGWFFMTVLVIVETIIMSKLLTRRLFTPSVMFPVIVSNVVSGVVGSMVSKAINSGWILVIWFPWVSAVEIDVNDESSLYVFILYIIVSFFATVTLELLLNLFFMKRRGFKPLLRATIIGNLASYLLGCFVLYAYSFLFYE